ncbi:MAG: bifunctional folylpolyglutamate synthase/dihydrofolate synthase [Bifidobacteriaceae bacterium]|jgi:dihydrofolate synthase/folylpolyglutamate synthase|nr:bifunctional folylpolyglutamate synthase/dihydrofolate synthase [Bifidobacteriaceae bacterium]
MTRRRQPDEALEDQVQGVYREILKRAPEHDFEPTTDRVRAAVDLLGEPQRAYQVIHVAGTNGKTSTARITESLVRAHGLRTGLFTSPHLTSVRERIAIDGQPISRADFLDAWSLVSAVVDLVDQRSVAAGGPKMSFFEVLTVLGLVAFADAPVDMAIIEVGMGGRWDATNVVQSSVQVITPISRDHEQWLGSSLEEIAAEKAGIIRTRAVFGRQPPAAAKVLEEAVIDAGATAYWLGRDFEVLGRELAVGGQVVRLRGLAGEYEEVPLGMFGAHQADNAAVAAAAVELLMSDAADPLPGAAYLEGMASAVSPGRIEVVSQLPTVLVDAAHNVAGAEALADAVDEAFPFPLIGLIGILGDKDAEGLLGVLEPVLRQVVVTRSTSPRALEPEVLGEVAREVFGADRVEVVERLDDALVRAIELAQIDSGNSPAPLATGVLATGSVTIAAEVRILLGRAS